jgi:signal transduction histidine kinase
MMGLDGYERAKTSGGDAADCNRFVSVTGCGHGLYCKSMDNLSISDKLSLLQMAFKGLEDDELQEMVALTEFRTYPVGHILCHEGEHEEVFYIIADGNAVVSKKMLEGEEDRVLRIAGRGDMVGEMALIQNAPRAATVRVTRECTVLEMEKADFETILSRSPRMAVGIIRITLDRIRENDQIMIEELLKTNKVLRQLDRNKLEFIQIAAHELRTPLTVLNGYVKVMNSLPEARTNPQLSQLTDGVIKGTERIHEVVNLMLDVTRIGSESLKVASVPISLRRIIDDLIQSFEKAASERKIKIYSQHAMDVPIPDIHSDPALIQKALYQLIVNAIKYSPDSSTIIITTRPILIHDKAPGVEIAVRDRGIGLDMEHQDLIFEKFYQVGGVALHSSGKTSFKGGGPGLGLAIVRGVARAHGGRVWVESAGHDEVNYTGSTFYLQLPVDPPKPSENQTT